MDSSPGKERRSKASVEYSSNHTGEYGTGIYPKGKSRKDVAEMEWNWERDRMKEQQLQSILVPAVTRQVCSQIEERMIYVSTTLFNTLTSLNQDSYVGVRKYISRLYPYTNKTADSGGNMERTIFSETL